MHQCAENRNELENQNEKVRIQNRETDKHERRLRGLEGIGEEE